MRKLTQKLIDWMVSHIALLVKSLLTCIVVFYSIMAYLTIGTTFLYWAFGLILVVLCAFAGEIADIIQEELNKEKHE